MSSKPLNANCKLKLTVISAHFLADADTFGKQDPFVKVECATYNYKTKVIEEGGKDVTWNEEFEMREISREIENNGNLVLTAFDSDGVRDEFLGWNQGIPYAELV